MQTIRIQGIDYTIKEFDGDLDANLMGREQYAKAKIYINKDMPKCFFHVCGRTF